MENPRVASRALPLMLSCLAAASFLLASCASPPLPAPVLPARSTQARGLVVIAHGSGDTAREWPLRLERALRELPVPQHHWDIHRIDWYEASVDRLAAPAAGYRIGHGVGRQIAERRAGYQVIHLVAHSAGAHLIHGIADGFTSATSSAGSASVAAAPTGAARAASEPAASEPAVLLATFLDPFVARSVFQMRWGVSRFGANVLAAENYFAAGDPVPFTNTALDHARNVDLTPLVPPRDDPPSDYVHYWPIQFYIQGTADHPAGILGSPMALLEDRITARHARARFASEAGL